MRNQTWQFLRGIARDCARAIPDAIDIIATIILALAAFFLVCNVVGWGTFALLGEPAGTRAHRIGTGFVVLGCAYVVGALCHFAYVLISDACRWVADRWRRAGYKAQGWGDHPHA